MATTDIVIFLVIAIFAYIGWRKGFIRTLIGPYALIISFSIAYICYLKEKSLFVVVLIALFGPIVLSLLLSFFLSIWHKAVDREAPLFWGSRLLGGLCNAAWGFCMAASFLAFVTIMPSKVSIVSKVKEKILDSYSGTLIKQIIGNRIPALAGIEILMEIAEDPKKMEKLQFTPEFKAVYQNENMQSLLSDEETLGQLKNKDIEKLLTNPKFHEVLKDKAMIEKIKNLAEHLSEEESKEGRSPQESQPIVYELEENGTMKIIY